MISQKYLIADRITGKICLINGIFAVRGAFPVKKVSSSHSKKQTVIITEQDIDEQELKAVIDGTGYESGAVRKEPYEKKGLFGFLK